MSNVLRYPTPPETSEPPVWTGTGFLVGDRKQPVLCYDLGSSGWSDELTEFHEDIGDEDHYMNVASREYALSRMERWLSNPEPVVLDIGCSSGYMIKALRRRLSDATVVGADFVRGPLEKLAAAVPDLPLLQFDLTRCPLPDGSVDGIVLLNVLEHIEDDDAAMRHVYRILRPGGVAVIEVPSGPNLFDIYDRQFMHHRRYRMCEVLRRLRAHGFTVVDRSHLGFLVYPGFWAIKKRNRRYLNSSQEQQRAIVLSHMRLAQDSRLMPWIMRVESRLRDWIYLPFGIRCVVTCTKTV
ncbi:MAG TPA: methyltransferase domain-containing protein [Candidatus Acidoferrales bacterium]|jgi:SAM-dependent methyltransferase|nr:methyltransferase domain-containing protein [Candidatus Acidoferrales bacterium]